MCLLNDRYVQGRNWDPPWGSGVNSWESFPWQYSTPGGGLCVVLPGSPLTQNLPCSVMLVCFLVYLPLLDHEPLRTGIVFSLFEYSVPSTYYVFDRCLLNEWNSDAQLLSSTLYSISSTENIIPVSHSG